VIIFDNDNMLIFVFHPGKWTYWQNWLSWAVSYLYIETSWT